MKQKSLQRTKRIREKLVKDQSNLIFIICIKFFLNIKIKIY